MHHTMYHHSPMSKPMLLSAASCLKATQPLAASVTSACPLCPQPQQLLPWLPSRPAVWRPPQPPPQQRFRGCNSEACSPALVVVMPLHLLLPWAQPQPSRQIVGQAQLQPQRLSGCRQQLQQGLDSSLHLFQAQGLPLVRPLGHTWELP